MPQLNFISDSAILIRFEGPARVEVSLHIARVFHFLWQKLEQAAPLNAVTNLHPAYESLQIDFDPRKCEPVLLKNFLQNLLHDVVSEIPSPTTVHRIPVNYQDELDLDEVAAFSGLTKDEVIVAHLKVEYTVAFLGFAPGFPYLLGLPEILQVPRKSTPRLKVPAGSVAIAGSQTGIYPKESPAGWQVIGRTSVPLFDPHQERPSLLNPGDRVQFVDASEAKSVAAHSSKSTEAANLKTSSQKPVLRIVEPGFFSSIQDAGRFHAAQWGVSAGGAADPVAHRLGQALIGNRPEAAAIEMTLFGATIVFAEDTWFALTGADCHAELDQYPIAMGAAIAVCAGQRLVCKEITNGLRTYLSVHKGFGIEEILGSRSTLVSAGWGGWQGRALLINDELPAGTQGARNPGSYSLPKPTTNFYPKKTVQTLRVTLGPQADWFSEAALETLTNKIFAVSNEANRNGLRLQGELLHWKKELQGKELVSEGVTCGSVQVTSNGQAMILFCEQQTTGGYPKIATVVRADWHRLGQLRPGDTFRFQVCTLEQAWEANTELENLLTAACQGI